MREVRVRGNPALEPCDPSHVVQVLGGQGPARTSRRKKADIRLDPQQNNARRNNARRKRSVTLGSFASFGAGSRPCSIFFVRAFTGSSTALRGAHTFARPAGKIAAFRRAQAIMVAGGCFICRGGIHANDRSRCSRNSHAVLHQH